jgi:Domain of unknown function (DUF4276)
MSRVYVLVEGQTEEAFLNELLVPYYASRGLYLYPIIVSTSPGYRGGVVSYAKIRPQIDRLCRQHASAHITTLFDLYALPNDFPGKGNLEYPSMGSGQQKAEFLQSKLAEDIDHRNFVPNLLVHEFEALLFTNIDAFQIWTNDDCILEPLRNVCSHTSPEDINDSQQTAPSKRILSAMPSYQKTFHGPLIANDIGLDAMRAACPHFNHWLNILESLITI